MKHLISSENGSRWITLSNKRTFTINTAAELNSIVDDHPSEDWNTILKDIHRTRSTVKFLHAKGIVVLILAFAVSGIGCFFILENTSTSSTSDSKTAILQPKPQQSVVGSCPQPQKNSSNLDTSRIDSSLATLDNMKAKSQEIKNSLLSPEGESTIDSKLSSERYSFGYK